MKSHLYPRYSVYVTIFIAALISSANVIAQTTAIFHLKDSTTQQAEIVASSKDAVFISGGSIKLKDIISVELLNDKYKDYFTRNNIPVSIIGNQVSATPIVIPPKDIAANELDQLYDGLERFQFQRTTGKGLQLVGALLVAGSAILATNEATKDEAVAGLSIGGAIVSTVGFVIDLNASKHLRFKRPKR